MPCLAACVIVRGAIERLDAIDCFLLGCVRLAGVPAVNREVAMGSPLCHFEIMAEDTERAQAFYGEVFSWKFDAESMPGYTLIQPGQEPNGARPVRRFRSHAVRFTTSR